MTRFKTLVDNRFRKLEEISNKYSSLFVGGAPVVINQNSRNASDNGYLKVRRTHLTNHCGSIEGQVYYKLLHGELVDVDYSFRFTSSVDKINILVNNKPQKQIEPYSFRFDKQIFDDPKWNHPTEHLQFSFSYRPRFEFDYKNETEAYKYLLESVHQTFCDKEYEVKYASISMTK